MRKRHGPAGQLGFGLGAAALVGLAGCAVAPAPRPAAEPVSLLRVDEGRARDLVSAYRRDHGLGGVALDPALQVVAQRQAQAMAAAGALCHTVDGTLPQRLAAGGADRSSAVENVSAGYGNLDAAILGWRRSPAHNANLLFGPMRRLGIGAAIAPGTRFKTFWSLVMTD